MVHEAMLIIPWPLSPMIIIQGHRPLISTPNYCHYFDICLWCTIPSNDAHFLNERTNIPYKGHVWQFDVLFKALEITDHYLWNRPLISYQNHWHETNTCLWCTISPNNMRVLGSIAQVTSDGLRPCSWPLIPRIIIQGIELLTL